MSAPTISPLELFQKIKSGAPVELIDVRTPAEFRELHATPARNVPLDVLDPKGLLAGRNGTSVEPIYVVCHTGSRASQACERFNKAGFTNVVSVEGGTAEWAAAGLPVVRGKKTISLERQVRIGAGLLVMLGVGLGYSVSPYFFGLSALIGAGLVFAGVTNTCGMGMLLAKMPWNRCGASCSSQK